MVRVQKSLDLFLGHQKLLEEYLVVESLNASYFVVDLAFGEKPERSENRLNFVVKSDYDEGQDDNVEDL